MKRLFDWYYGKASIKKKLVLSYLLLVLLPIILLGIYAYHISKTNLMDQMRRTVNSNVEMIEVGLENNLSRENDNIKYLAYNVRFREVLENGDRDINSLVQEMNSNIEPTFWYFLTSDHTLNGITIYTDCINRDVGSFLIASKWNALENWGDYHKEHFNTRWTLEDGNIYASRTLLDAHSSSKPIGVLRLTINHDNLLQVLKQPEYLHNGFVLMDETGNVILQRAVANKNTDLKIQQAMQTNFEGSLETSEYLLQKADPLSNGWTLYYYIDKSEIANQLRLILGSTLGLVAICMIVVTVLISILSSILSSRILDLKRCADQVAKGNFAISGKTEYTDEIGVVTNSFVAMGNKINEMMGEMYRLGLEKRATELKALQAMINPHFLYNCLSSIKWKAIRAEQDEIGDLTNLLARFYRAALNEGKQITTVKSELENIKAYIELQQRAFDNSFECEMDLDEDGQESEMPNFLLQPIVENAIFHGVNCLEDKKGIIRVEYVHEGSDLVFRIYNNGPDIDVKVLDDLLKKPGKGYGIYNIQERINIYYGEHYGITVHASEDDMICFEVRIRERISNELKGQ